MKKGMEQRWAKGLWFKAVAVLLTIGGFILYLLPQVQMMAWRYEAEKLRARYEALADMNKLLRLEVASLRAFERIEGIASEKLQMVYPGPEQIILVKWGENGGK